MMYKCTLNPSNLIQAQTGIDTATSYVKQFLEVSQKVIQNLSIIIFIQEEVQ